MKLDTRSAEIDFLRGIAVMLVLFSHHWVFTPLNEMGWIGVDLFFVLSGFLVSGLLFTEYKKYGNIRPKLFLIRRGFKIYPLFYFSILVTVVLFIFFPNSYLHPESKTLFLNTHGILSGAVIEIFFLQSLVFGFWGHHWSLSVEEFFYFSLALLLYIIVKKKKLENHKFFFRAGLIILISCLFLRIFFNIISPFSPLSRGAATLRMDSLFAGVLVSYLYHFRYAYLQHIYLKYRKIMLLSILPLICYTPFIHELHSIFILTIGFTLIYIAFSFLLLIFLFEKNIAARVKKIVTPFLYRMTAKVGFYSYSIYLFHMYIIRFLVGEHYVQEQYLKGVYTYPQVLLSFVAYFLGSMLLGIGMSYLIERPTLKLRDKYYPRRNDVIVNPQVQA